MKQVPGGEKTEENTINEGQGYPGFRGGSGRDLGDGWGTTFPRGCRLDYLRYTPVTKRCGSTKAVGDSWAFKERWRIRPLFNG